MLKFLAFLCLVGALVAFPSNLGPRSQEDVEGFANYLKKTLEEREITLDEAMAENPDAKAWENSGKFEGDMLLFDEQIEELVAEYAGNSSNTRTGILPARHRWPGNAIPYEIAPNTFTQAQLNMIQTAFNFFQTNSCVRWVRRSNQRDFVRITGRQTGCYAHVGHWQGFGVHTLNLARGCFNVFIVIHEMMHTAGFQHMHQTYTRNNYITINWANIQRGMEFNFNAYTNRDVTMLSLPYEYASNMHYDQFAFSTNRRPTIVPRRNDNGQMGQLQFVTRNDALRLNRLYNCPGAWRVQVREADLNKPLDSEFRKLIADAGEEEMEEWATILAERKNKV